MNEKGGCPSIHGQESQKNNLAYNVYRLKGGLRKPLVDIRALSSDWAFRCRLKWTRAFFHPKLPERTCWNGWVNTALKSVKQVEAALEHVRFCGLPPHVDVPKNWDSLIALGLVLERTSTSARVLDAGATLYSVILPWLCMYGYKDLWGIDLIYDRPIRRGPIRYEKGDLTQTRFDDDSFDVITCLSVIEHGVLPDAYLREMSRILRPGGLLITSTDYWADPLDTYGQIAFGVSIKIFSRSDIEAFLASAENYGLKSIQPVGLECQDKAVRWRQYALDYTFVNFVLEKAMDF